MRLRCRIASYLVIVATVSAVPAAAASGGGFQPPTPTPAPTPAPPPPVEGRLYRESSQPEVYLISAGKKIWVPTPDALFAMGFSWADVTVVPDGALGAFPRFDIPRGSATPGSLVFPPNRVSHFPLAVVPNAVKVAWRGKEVQLVDLYGWLRFVAGGCNGADPDFHYELELDTDWAIAQGIDLNKIYRVGNVATEGLRLPGFSPRRAVAIPLIKVELNAWEWGGVTAGRAKPADWTFAANCDRAAGEPTWPFDPLHPTAGQTLAAMDPDVARRGPYVRIAGSLVTDSPHDVQHRPNVFLSRWFAITDGEAAEWEGSVPDWHPGVATNTADHYARWTEIHPPDLIAVQPGKEPRVTVRAVALAARVGAAPFGLSNSCEEAEFDMFPEATRAPGEHVGFEELRGPETYWPWGEDANNGSWITVLDDHVRVKARVCGGPVFGSPGRFKAIYRVWWKPAVAGPGPRSGTFVTADRDEIHYLVEPNAVGNDVVDFRLCLGPGLTWEKRMNMPDGEGASWDLVVRDNKRCDTNGLWAGQVANGQSLTFSKAKTFGKMTQVHVMPMSTFAPMPGGTRVTLTWVRD